MKPMALPGWHAALSRWLLACAALVLCVLVVGGITRLTHSGLSIVHWQPVSGTLPPLSQADWEARFAEYRGSPEFQQRNAGMTLEQFRPIFWWEYAHRLLGRVAGAAFLLPLLYFAARGALGRGLALRLCAMFLLGGLQGALGWYMVKSGLVDDPQVNPARLAAHLGMALLLIGLLFWTAWELRYAAPPRTALRQAALLAVPAVLLMALSGALVAGSHAGLAYANFPYMGEGLLPPGLWTLEPWYENFLHNLGTVQLLHRSLALLVIAAVAALYRDSQCLPAGAPARAAAHRMLAALVLQITLGIATLMSGVALPLAAAHQASGVLLYLSILWTGFAGTLPIGSGPQPMAGRALPATR